MIKEARRRSDMIGFIGGPPCPDFSVGGKNRGRDGDNGKLSATYIEIICQQKPDFFLFENVKGLWSTNKHRQFYEELKKEIQRSGYITIDKLINTIEYGVPQDRERVILLGFKKSVLNNLNLRVGKRDELTDDEFPWNNRIIYHAQDIFALDWPKTNEFQEDSVISPPSNIPQELTVEFWFRKNDVYNHENANHYFKPRQGLHRFLTISEGDDSRKSFKRLHRWRYSPTACYGNNEVHLHPYKARRISVAEALAIQSMPKDFILPPSMSLTNMFKTIGNGVPYLAARGIAETIKDFLGVND